MMPATVCDPNRGISTSSGVARGARARRAPIRSAQAGATTTSAASAIEQPAASRAEYWHLEPLLAAYANAPMRGPRRSQLRARLITGYLPVARHIARRYAHRGEPVEDLVQVASVGLINAIDRFEPERGCHFLCYAVPTITGEVRRHFRDKTWSVRVPRRQKDLCVPVNKVIAEFSDELSRAPRPSEIADRLSISVEDVLGVLEASQSYRSASLDEVCIGEADSPTLRDRLGETDARYEQFVNSHALAPYLAALPGREHNILIMRFFHDMTQSQIAERMGISQVHVSRLLSNTFARLREAVERDQPPIVTAESTTVLAALGGAGGFRDYSRPSGASAATLGALTASALPG
jgi:RNA polymerase sigma-B factor